MPALSKYKRWRIRAELAASRMWMAEYLNHTVQCMLCPPTRIIATRTMLRGSYHTEAVAVCYKCLSHLSLKRERQQPFLERRLYGIKTSPLPEYGRHY